MMRTSVPAPMSDAALILTLKLDEAAFGRLDGLRRAHFPAALNYIPAHLTLFHHLPGDRLQEVMAELHAAAPRGPMRLRATGLRKLGRGTAVEVGGSGLAAWRGRLGAGLGRRADGAGPPALPPACHRAE